MEFEDKDFIGAGIGVILVVVAKFLIDDKFFPLLLGLGIIIAVVPIISKIIIDNRIQSEKEDMFLEFARNLVESVKTGTPISKSIINMKSKNFGALTPHVIKLANQIALGIPLNKSLKIFSQDVKNKSIARALTLIGQAERAGGDIGEILEAVAGAVSLSDSMKKERKAAVSNLVSQGYIIFLVFIVIILVLQFQILPMVSGLGDMGGTIGLSAGGVQVQVEQDQISNSFLYLILVQGFFTGLVIGQLAEGNIRAGIKHSFSLAFLSFIISTVANIILGS